MLYAAILLLVVQVLLTAEGGFSRKKYGFLKDNHRYLKTYWGPTKEFLRKDAGNDLQGKAAHGTKYDVAIVGGGFAGLSAAMFFGRALISAVVINAESPRNKVTDYTHNFLTRDGVRPTEFLKIAKVELGSYSEFITYSKDTVVDVKKENGTFKVDTEGRKTYVADNVLFATGMQDHLDQLHLPGVFECYGKSVYHCAFCDGFERRNFPIALFSTGNYTYNLARLMHHWTNDLVLFTKPSVLTGDQKSLFCKKGIRVVEEKVERIEHNKGYMSGIRLSNGEVIPRKVAFLGSTVDSGSNMPARLGVPKLAQGNYQTTEPWGKTKVKGVYVAGDLKDAFTGAITAASQGNQVADKIALQIIQQKFDQE